MTTTAKPRLVGFNHVAIEVGDIEEALSFYSSLFSFELRSRSPDMAFIDLGDQFLALQQADNPTPTGGRTSSAPTSASGARRCGSPTGRPAPGSAARAFDRSRTATGYPHRAGPAVTARAGQETKNCGR